MIHLEVARLHAFHYLQTEIQEYSQWFCSVENKVTNDLSRDNNRSDNELMLTLPLTGSSSFRDCSTSQRNNFMADLTAALVATEEGVGGGTHKNDT